MSFGSPYPDVEIPNVSVFDFLFSDLSDEDKALTAFIDGRDGAETTYGTLVGLIDAVGGGLTSRGIGLGDVVALHAPNVPFFAAAFHGILRIGAVATTVNALFTGADIAKQLTDSKAKLLITVSPLLEAALEGARKVGLSDEQVIVLDGAEGFASAIDLISTGTPAPAVDFDPATHLAVLPYSSGTTGIPKGVMLTHRNLVANVCQIQDRMAIKAGDKFVAVLPFFHIYGMTVLLNLALAKRTTLITMPRFDLVQFLTLTQDHKATHLFIAPPVAVALAKHPLVDQYDLSSVKVIFSGAASLDEELGLAVSKRLDTLVAQGYGMSEMSPVSHAHPLSVEGVVTHQGDYPLSSVGPAVPNTRNKLVDPATGEEVAYPEAGSTELSEPGELWVSGPNIMVGYLANETATKETLDADGYLHTGDLGVVDGAGNVYIVDRIKELIKYKGYQVPPAELEAVLLTSPDIADVAVIGVLDADGEEVPKAFVVRQPDSTIDEQGVIDFVADRVSPHKKVRQVEFIDIVPKSASGKILRKDLRVR